MKGTAPEVPSDPLLAEAMKDAQAMPAKELSDVSKLSAELREKYVLWNELITKIEECDAEIRRLEERELPKAMLDLGMTDFGLAGGGRVELTKVYLAGIKVDDRSNAFKWMRDTGNEALIKAEVKVGFAKGDVERAAKLSAAIEKMIQNKLMQLRIDLDALEAQLEAEGNEVERKRLQGAINELKEEIGAYSVAPTLEQSVHWQTLRAFAKEQVIREEKAIEDGELDPVKDKDKLLPRELLGVYVFDKAVVSGLPKRKANKYEQS